jgi:hypothetical protein
MGVIVVRGVGEIGVIGLLAKQNGIRSLLSLNGNEWHSLPMVAEWQSANFYGAPLLALNSP